MAMIHPYLPLLKNLLPPEEIVFNAARGMDDPIWEQRRAASYSDRLVLASLSMEAELHAVIQTAGIQPGMRVLDAACGPGVISRYLCQAGAIVVGIDANPQMLELAQTLPVEPSFQLRFERADLNERLPFADNEFDAVWLGDFWSDTMFSELRRVVRPSGAYLFRMTGILPGMNFAWDSEFEARMRLAYLQSTLRRGYRGEGGTSWYGELCRAGPWTHLQVKTFLVERLAPVPSLFELNARQAFGLFLGAFLKDSVSESDWEILARGYDPASPDDFFRRGDGHFIQSISLARATG